MPNYVTITPKYQVIDLADMLKVPEMITRETKEANKEIEDYKDQISKNRALLGPDADKIFSPYDDLMNALIDNPTVADRQNIANQLRNRYRDINAKVEAAKPKYDKMAEMFMQHPDYIGNPGSFMDYYNNPNYTPTVVDGAKIATDSAKAMKAFVAMMKPKPIGTLEGDKTKDVYGKGYTPDELSAFVDDAISGRLQTPEGRTLASILEKNGYGNLQTDAERARAQNYLKQGVAEGFMTTDILTNATEQAKLNARYSGSRSSGSGSRGKEVETTFIETDKNSEKWTSNKTRYEYKIKRNTESGRVTSIKRRPLKKNEKGQWVPVENEFKDAPKEAEVWNINARLHSYKNKDAQYTFYDEGDLPDYTEQKEEKESVPEWINNKDDGAKSQIDVSSNEIDELLAKLANGDNPVGTETFDNHEYRYILLNDNNLEDEWTKLKNKIEILNAYKRSSSKQAIVVIYDTSKGLGKQSGKIIRYNLQ